MISSKLSQQIKRLGVELDIDRDEQYYAAVCPTGFRFEAGRHEIVIEYEYEPGKFVEGGLSEAQARDVIASRLEEYDTLEPCDCSFCRGRAATSLRERQSGIGASEVSVVPGLAPWKGAAALWSEKAGRSREAPDQERKHE